MSKRILSYYSNPRNGYVLLVDVLNIIHSAFETAVTRTVFGK